MDKRVERVDKVESVDTKQVESHEINKTITQQNTSSDDNFVANFIVQPEFQQIQQQEHKRKIEFVPYFERKVFEVMVPAGRNTEESLVAIIPFYSSVDSKSPATFTLVNDSRGWFSIGVVNHTLQEIYAVDLVQILLNANSDISTKASGLNGIYPIEIEASQGNNKASASLQVEILALKHDNNDSVEMADLILSRLESSSNITEDFKDIEKEDEDKIIIDFANDQSMDNLTLIDLMEQLNQERIAYTEIKLEFRGLEGSKLAVSENIQNSNSVPDFSIRLSTDLPLDEVAVLEIEPIGIFTLRPKFLLPNEESRLIVVDSKMLDFDNSAKSLEFTITAKFVGSDKITQSKFIVEKRNEPDRAPKFEKSEYTFHVSESSENNTIVGHIVALNDDSKHGDDSKNSDEPQIQYTLLGYGSQNFRISNGSLILNCFADFSTECLDYEQTTEYNFLIMAVDKNGLSSDAIPLTISVDDSNDNGPVLETFSNEIEISDSEIRSPFLFAVNDLDSFKNRDNLVELSNDAARFLSLERLSSSLYQIQMSRSATAGLHHLDITVRDAHGENLSQKTRVKVNVLNSTPKLMFQRQHYERTINAETLQTGSPIVQLELDGAESNTIRFMAIEGNPGWLSVEEYTGNVYVGELGSNGIRAGKFVVKMAAIDRDSQRILATTELNLVVKNSNVNSKAFNKPLTTVFVDRDSIKDDLNVLMVSDDIELKLIEVNAWDDDLYSIGVENSVQIKDGHVVIKKEILQKINSMSIKFGAGNEEAMLQVFSTRDPEKVKELENSLSIPKFAVPWINENTVIALKIQEELPIEHVILCMPALNQLDGSLIKNVELSGDASEYFKLVNGCIAIQTRIDFEQLSTKHLNLELQANLNNHQAKAKIQIQLIDIDDNAPDLQFLTSNSNPLNLMENSKGGQKVAEILVLDKDHVGKNQQFRFKLRGLQSENFNIKIHEQNQSILVLSVALGAKLDREESEDIALKLTVTDMTGNSNDLAINIQLLDENDNSPTFTKTSAEIDVFDNWPEGMELFTFTAYDLDAGNNSKITYSLDQTAGKYFEIDSTSGSIKTSSILSGLARPEPYIIGILAIDNGNPPQSAMAELHVHIHEANGMSNVDSQEIRIISPPVDLQLNLTENMPAGSLIYTVEAVIGMPSDSLDVDLIHYSIEEIDSTDAGWLTIDENTGDVHLLRTLDYERQPYITVGYFSNLNCIQNID